jgi:RimJ/RimL family protein N-acetyltransferase
MAKGADPSPEVIVLASGRVLDLRGPRSKSLLDAEGLAYCRANGIALAYDPVQIGLVPAHCEDDIAGDLSAGDLSAGGLYSGGMAHAWPGRTARAVVDAPRRPQRIVQLERRYRLRRWADTDLQAYVALLDDPEVWRYLPDPFPAPLTAEIAADLIELSNTGAHHDVVAVEVDWGVVGQVRLLFDGVRSEARGAEISYWLGRQHWGRGVAGDVVELFSYQCFQKYPNLETIFARVPQDNLPSARVLTKSRYRAEGPTEDSVWTRYRIARGDVLPENLSQ